MGSPRRIDPTTHRTMNERSYHGSTSRSYCNENQNSKNTAVLNNFISIGLEDVFTSHSILFMLRTDSIKGKPSVSQDQVGLFGGLKTENNIHVHIANTAGRT